MSPTLKRLVVLAAATKAVDKVMEMRRPKRSLFRRAAPGVLALAAGGGVAYLAATGRLAPIIDRIRSAVAGPESPWDVDEGAAREIRLPSDAPTAATAPSSTTPIVSG